jgi:hypothetical protein
MNNTAMSAAYQNMPTQMDFPSDFLEPTISESVQQTTVNTYYSPTTGFFFYEIRLTKGP